MRLQPPEALGGLLHGGAGPAERHPGVPPAFDVAADLPDGPVHVLDDVGAGQRPAQFDRQSKAGDGEDFVDPLQDAAGNAGIVMFQAAGQVFDQAFGLVGVIQFPRLSQRFALHSAGGDQAMVADQPAGETREDRCQGRAPWELRHLPDGRSRGAE